MNSYPFTKVEGDRGQGAGNGEKRGREVYRGREKRGREAGEKGKNRAKLRNISQSKIWKEAGANKHMAGTGIRGYGKREVYPLPPLPPCPLSPHTKGHNTLTTNEFVTWRT